MRHGLRHGAFFESESFYETTAFCACFVVAFKHCHLHDILLSIRLNETVFHLQIKYALKVANLVRNDLYNTCLYTVLAFRRFDSEAVRSNLIADMHCIISKVREAAFTDIRGHLAVLRNHVSVDDGTRDADVVKVVEEDDVCAFARSDASHLVIHAETGRGIDRYILDCLDRIQTFLDSASNYIVHVPILYKCIRVGVVRDEAGIAVIDFVIEYRADDDRHIVPCAAVAHQGIHAAAHLLDHILGAGRLVAASDT